MTSNVDLFNLLLANYLVQDFELDTLARELSTFYRRTTGMVYLFGVSLVAILLGFAIKQMSVILMHGSVFAWLRQAVQLRAEKGKWLFIKLHELFTCPLCMTSQVALWVVGAPLVYVLLSFDWNSRLFDRQLVWYEQAAATLLVSFVVSMCLAAIALWIWDIVDYKPNKFRAERKKYESLLAEQARQLQCYLQANKCDSTVLVNLSSALTFEQFTIIVGKTESVCQHIGCATLRETCRITIVETILDQWWRLNGDNHPPFAIILLKDAMQVALRFHFSNKWRHQDSATLPTHCREAFATLQRHLVGSTADT